MLKPLRTVSALFLSLFLTFSVSAEQPLTKHKVGVIIALSGPLAPVGTSIQRAISIADTNLDSSDQIEFIFEDDQFQAKYATSAAEKLIVQNQVEALITFSGSTSLAVAEIARRNNTPLIAITPLTLVSEKGGSVYTIFPPTSKQIDLLSQTIKQRNFKRIAVLTSTQDALLQFKEIFAAQNKDLIVFDQEVAPGDTNLTSTVTKILREKPDVFVNFTLPPQISIISKNLRTQGFDGPILGGPTLYNPPEIQAASGTLTGAMIPGPKSTASSLFLDQYFKKFNEPCISEGTYGYDAGALITKAIQSDNITNFLANTTSFEGISGTYPKSAGNQFEIPLELKVITADGTLKKAE